MTCFILSLIIVLASILGYIRSDLRWPRYHGTTNGRRP